MGRSVAMNDALKHERRFPPQADLLNRGPNEIRLVYKLEEI